MIPGFYNHNYQILQTADYVVILVEMIHDARIIPLTDRPHLPPQIRQWLGDSRGRWEDDTLVVETSHFSAKGDQRVRNLVLAGSEHSHVVERFRRVDADTIDYRFTVTDPRSYRNAWTAQVPMAKLGGPLFEYRVSRGELWAAQHSGWCARGRTDRRDDDRFQVMRFLQCPARGPTHFHRRRKSSPMSIACCKRPRL